MYISTRDNYHKVTSAEAIALGMVPEGGLFVPEVLPKISTHEIQSMLGKDYQSLACWILGKFLPDYSEEDIKTCVYGAYSDNFDHQDIAPLVKLDEKKYILELWHGPTAAFKDMALQLTPRLLVKAVQKVHPEQKTVILVATSGDTGKAALEGFKDVAGTEIIVFYPADGVSAVQKLQMVTTEGQNTHVVAVEGNFDDCQSAVKEIFADKATIAAMQSAGMSFSSANSINWGRLLPQIVYYFAAYLRLVALNQITFGDLVDFVVPTGNFGNILAAWYAKEMNLPIGKLICASNENKVLTDFFATGVYDRQREFKQTNSPSMDILISSNLERFLFAMTDHDGQKVAAWLNQLQTEGCFTVDETTKTRMDNIIVGGFATEAETLATIKSCFEQYHYLLDTHTAVALKVYEQYQKNSGSQRLAVIDSTANPYKFVASVYQAITGENENDELALLDKLSHLSQTPVHRGLQNLDKKSILHHRQCTKNGIIAEVKNILQL